VSVHSESNDNNVTSATATTNKKQRIEGITLMIMIDITLCHFVEHCSSDGNSSVAVATSKDSNLQTLCVYSDTSSDDESL